MSGFHDVLLDLPAAFGLSGGPERRTDVALLASGREQRNARWAGSRRRWEIGGGIIGADAAHDLLAFFEARGGRLNGFRFRDPLDWKSCAPGGEPSVADQVLGTGDGVASRFRLVKRYVSGGAESVRSITRPVPGAVGIAVAGVSVVADVDHATGWVELPAAPPQGALVTAGFRFDTPVRFDTDALELSLEAFDAVRIGRLSIVEITG